MVSTRRTRVLILTAVLFTVGLLIFAVHGPRYDIAQDARLVQNSAGAGGAKSTDNNVDKEILEVDVGEGKAHKTQKEKESMRKEQSGEEQADLTTTEGKEFNPELEYLSILKLSPVIVFSKSYCPHSQFVKNLLQKEYAITPEVQIVELDKHPSGPELQKFIKEKTGRSTVPNVIVAGKSLGGGDEMRALHKSGELADTFHDEGPKMLTVVRKSPMRR